MMHYLPTKIYHGARCLKDNSGCLQGLGTRAGIVTGKTSAKKCGALTDVLSVLEKLKITSVLFDDVEENPSVATCFKAAEFFKEQGVDFVIGIGGGSPLDAAKAIALLLANPTLIGEDLYTFKGALSHLPVVEIPTTAGTGAEVTPNAVLSIPETGKKSSIAYSMYPSIAFCDYRYLKSLPRSIRISTAVDALAHLLESFLSAKADRFSDMYCCMGLTIFTGSLATVGKEEALSSSEWKLLMDASTIAGMAIAQTGTSLPHAFSYPLTMRNHIAHGTACGITLGGYVRLLEQRGSFKAKTALNILGFSEAAALEECFKKLLPKASIPAVQKEEDIKSVLSNPKKTATCPFSLTEEELRGIYLF